MKMPQLPVLFWISKKSIGNVDYHGDNAQPRCVDDSVGEWFEIYNNGDQSINLNGLEISSDDGVEHTIGEDYVLEPGVLGFRS